MAANNAGTQGPSLDTCRLAEGETLLELEGWKKHPKARPSYWKQRQKQHMSKRKQEAADEVEEEQSTRSLCHPSQTWQCSRPSPSHMELRERLLRLLVRVGPNPISPAPI